MFASPVLTNIKGFSYITVIVSHQWEKSILVQSHAILNHMWLGQFYDILPILKLPVGLQFNVWAAKRQRHHCFCRQVVSRQESYQWKGLKQLGSTCDSTSPRRSSSHISECFQKSRLEGLCSSYFQVALQRCRACRSWVSGAHFLHQWRLIDSMTCFANVASPQETPVYMHRSDSLPSCKEKRLYFKIHQNTTLVIDWYTRCDCRHFGDCAVWQYLFSIPRCPLAKNVLRPNASIDCKREAGDSKT